MLSSVSSVDLWLHFKLSCRRTSVYRETDEMGDNEVGQEMKPKYRQSR